MKYFTYMFFALLLGAGGVVSAQCSLVDQALQDANRCRSLLYRNSACFGHDNITASPYRGFTFNSGFNSVGDIEPIEAIRSIEPSRLNAQNGTWGIVMMQVQADNPNSQQEHATFIAMGGTQVENLIPPLRIGDEVNINTTEGDDLNIRSGPSTSNDVVARAPDGTVIRLLEGPQPSGGFVWWRVEVLNSGARGWVVESVDDNNELLRTVLPGGITESVGPMQVFQLSNFSPSNYGDCSNAPRDGLVIQTPDNRRKMRFEANSVEIVAGSTVFLQTPNNRALVVNALEGDVTVRSRGVTRDIPVGQRVSVPLGSDYQAVNSPGSPEAIPFEEIRNLPLDLLPDPVDISDFDDGGSSNPDIPLIPTDGSFWTLNGNLPAGQTIMFDIEITSSNIYFLTVQSNLELELILRRQGVIVDEHDGWDSIEGQVVNPWIERQLSPGIYSVAIRGWDWASDTQATISGPFTFNIRATG